MNKLSLMNHSSEHAVMVVIDGVERFIPKGESIALDMSVGKKCDLSISYDSPNALQPKPKPEKR